MGGARKASINENDGEAYAAVASPNDPSLNMEEGCVPSVVCGQAAMALALSLSGAEPENSEGESVHDAELLAATEDVDASTEFLGVSKGFVEKYLAIVVSISLGAVLGVGARVLLTELVSSALSKRQTELVYLLGFGFYLPNVVGCFVMGIASRIKPLLPAHCGVYMTGVTTGFCGCCTTFASWDVGVAATFVHGKWLTGLLLIGIQVTSAIASYRCGGHLGDAVIDWLADDTGLSLLKRPTETSILQTHLAATLQSIENMQTQATNRAVVYRMSTAKERLETSRQACADLLQDLSAVDVEAVPASSPNLLEWGLLGMILLVLIWVPPFLAGSTHFRSRLFALALGPFGALLRYYLSLFNADPKYQNFPLFTFIPNVAASVLSCLFVVIGSLTTNHNDTAYKTYVFLVEGGLTVGFCGSLSTVSTWVNELDTLVARNRIAAYRYALASIVVSQLASCIILGVYSTAHPHLAPLIV